MHQPQVEGPRRNVGGRGFKNADQREDVAAICNLLAQCDINTGLPEGFAVPVIRGFRQHRAEINAVVDIHAQRV
jgi:hypothetical protein